MEAALEVAYREIRRATAEEIRLACSVNDADVARVVDAWVDCESKVELLFFGFTRVVVDISHLLPKGTA